MLQLANGIPTCARHQSSDCIVLLHDFGGCHAIGLSESDIEDRLTGRTVAAHPVAACRVNCRGLSAKAAVMVNQSQPRALLFRELGSPYSEHCFLRTCSWELGSHAQGTVLLRNLTTWSCALAIGGQLMISLCSCCIPDPMIQMIVLWFVILSSSSKVILVW